MVLVFAHLCQHKNGLPRMSLAAALGENTGAPSLFSGGMQSNHLAVQGLYLVDVNQSRLQLVIRVTEQSVSWVMLVYSQPFPDCLPVLTIHTAVLYAGTVVFKDMH